MSNGLKLVAAVVVIGIAVAVYWARAGDSRSPGDFSEYNAYLGCRSCGARFGVSLDVNSEELPPYKCSQCGKKECWPLKKCRQCKEIFLPLLEGTPPDLYLPMVATCTKCGSQSTGAASVADQPASPGKSGS